MYFASVTSTVIAFFVNKCNNGALLWSTLRYLHPGIVFKVRMHFLVFIYLMHLHSHFVEDFELPGVSGI